MLGLKRFLNNRRIRAPGNRYITQNGDISCALVHSRIRRTVSCSFLIVSLPFHYCFWIHSINVRNINFDWPILHADAYIEVGNFNYWLMICVLFHFDGRAPTNRLWSSGCRSRYQGGIGRLKFLKRPFCIIGEPWDSIGVVWSTRAICYW